MGRKLLISRSEAEFLVDILEEQETPQWDILAANIRNLFGMASKEREEEFKSFNKLKRGTSNANVS